jgi:hypothetical protein
VFDQGPLYLLSEAQLLEERLRDWRRENLDTWAEILDAVVWLDAPDAVLVDRIDGRGKWHRVKGQPAEIAIDVLGEARAVYEGIISRLEGHDNGPTVLRFDTSRIAPEDVADVVINAVGGFSVPAGPGPPPEHLPIRG